MTAVWEPLARAIRRVHRGAMTGTQAFEQAAVEYAIYTKPAPEKPTPTPYIIFALAGLFVWFMVVLANVSRRVKKKSGSRKQPICMSLQLLAMTLLTAHPLCRRCSRIVIRTPPR